MRLFNEAKIPPPQDSSAFPHTPKPVYLEIGCGVGWHPIKFAESHPDRFIIGIERTTTKFKSFKRRADHHDLPNLLAIWGDAISWTVHRVPSGSLSGIFILYPNPYPKSKHKNRHWLEMPFFQYLVTKMKPGAELTLATDQKDYFEKCIAIASHPIFPLEVVRSGPVDSTTTPRTHFEKKYFAQKRQCYETRLMRPIMPGTNNSL